MGLPVGLTVGEDVGVLVGLPVGLEVGDLVGLLVGILVGLGLDLLLFGAFVDLFSWRTTLDFPSLLSFSATRVPAAFALFSSNLAGSFLRTYLASARYSTVLLIGRQEGPTVSILSFWFRFSSGI